MKVASFYRFVRLQQPARLRETLQTLCDEQQLLGTVLLADEGVNGTLAGARHAIRAVFDFLQTELRLDEALDVRWSDADQAPFRRMRVREKKEIVTMGRPDIAPQSATGRHVSAADWNRLLEDPQTVVVDTRNHYEIEVGTFPGAVDPGTDSFREFPQFAAALAAAGTDRPLAMFCTGGIRCEKATALMHELGFSDVYQLQGGILSYLEQVDEQQNRWTGECFVFDSRVAVDRDRAEGGYVQCHACRRPLSTEDLQSADYREGVSCPKCIAGLQDERAARLEERRRQVELAKARGATHIGPDNSR